MHRLLSTVAPLLIMICPLLAGAQAQAPDGATEVEEAWYVLQFDGEPAGWMQMLTYRTGDHYVTATTSEMTIRRGAVELQVTDEQRFTETVDGVAVSLHGVSNTGAQPVVKTMTFNDDGTRTLEIVQNGRAFERTLDPIEGDWLTPRQVDAYLAERDAAGDDVIEFTSLDLSMGNDPATSRMERHPEAGRVEVFGKVVPASLWTATYDKMPGVEIEIAINDDGEMVRTDMDLMGMRISTLLADRTLALAEVNPPELMASTFISPSRPIEDPRNVERTVYRVTFNDTDADLAPASAGFQTVTVDNGVVTVTVDENAAPFAEPAPGPEYLEASPTLDHEDEAIVALYQRATADLPDDADPALVARTLRAFVNDFIEAKDLSVGFATASETCRTAQGDCTEHGVLLAALLRVAGIPSRTVTGLVYVDYFAGGRQIFGYHMWSQAYVDVDGDGPLPTGWYDYDATLPVDFDAAHIALSTSALSEGMAGEDMMAILPLMGGMDIEVVEAE